jgi:hypothetical protein
MTSPTEAGDVNSIPLDLAPQAVKTYIQILDKADHEARKWFLINVCNYYDSDKPQEFETLMKLAEFDSFPEWAKNQIEEIMADSER